MKSEIGARTLVRQAGVTLIELLVVVCVVAILTMIAYPSYANYLVKSRRAQATACIQEAAQFMERFYTTNLRYDQAVDGSAVSLPATSCVQDMSSNYTLSVLSVSANAFVLQVVPKGTQATKDTQCATLKLSQSGAKAITGTGTPSACW